MPPKCKTYYIEAWVHPKDGGDDYMIDLTIPAYNENEAKTLTKRWLSKRSSVTDDFRFITKRVYNLHRAEDAMYEAEWESKVS